MENNNSTNSYVSGFLNQLPEDARNVATEYLVSRRKLEGKVKQFFNTINETQIIKDPTDPLYIPKPEAPSELLDRQAQQVQDVVTGVDQQIRQDLLGNAPQPAYGDEYGEIGIPPPPPPLPQQQPLMQEPVGDIPPEAQELASIVDEMKRTPALQADVTVSAGGGLSDMPLGYDDLEAARQIMNGLPPTANQSKYKGAAALKFQRDYGSDNIIAPPPPPQQPVGV